MTIKTILLHLAEDPRNAARTAAAVALAEKHAAHLVGLYTVSPLVVPGYVGAELPAQVYADYIQAQGSAFLRADFSGDDDLGYYLCRMLGIDAPARRVRDAVAVQG